MAAAAHDEHAAVHDPELDAILATKRAAAGPNVVILPRNSNQAIGIAQFCHDFMNGKLGAGPDQSVLERVELFHTDSVICGLSALALRCNAPTVLRQEALDEYQCADPKQGATPFGSSVRVSAEKAIAANCSAVREWDSNGTVFGFNDKLGTQHQAGEFGHNDFYPVVVAACQQRGLDGRQAALAMLLLDEVRGRLAEVFSLKSYKIDHVVHGAIASAAVYGALMGATLEQIESAIGMVVAHYIPWRAIRAGHQLSDSKGASAALSTEVAIMSVKRAMRGFIGPKDIFRNPESVFRYMVKTPHDYSPFDLALTHSGSDFALMGMHVKLGLYEHQSAGALQGVIDVLRRSSSLLSASQPSSAELAASIKAVRIVAYQPAFGIIGDPAKRDPHTRQSADHSMVYIVATLLRKALEMAAANHGSLPSAVAAHNDAAWQSLILTPHDYSKQALVDPVTRALMQRISFSHGGPEYDAKYPDGIPTSVVITDAEGVEHDSGFVMYPSGHARNTTADLNAIVANKFRVLGAIAVGAAVDSERVSALVSKLSGLANKTAAEMNDLYNVQIDETQQCID